jgi:hypothetical protein
MDDWNYWRIPVSNRRARLEENVVHINCSTHEGTHHTIASTNLHR